MQMPLLQISLICIFISIVVFSWGVIPKVGGIFFGYGEMLINNVNITCYKCALCTEKTDGRCTGQILPVDCCDVNIILTRDDIICQDKISGIFNLVENI